MISEREPGGPTRLTRQFSIRVTGAEWDEIAAMAETEERRFADVARRIFRRGLNAGRVGGGHAKAPPPRDPRQGG